MERAQPYIYIALVRQAHIQADQRHKAGARLPGPRRVLCHGVAITTAMLQAMRVDATMRRATSAPKPRS